MTFQTIHEIWQEWLESRPPIVRALAEKYPPGTAFNIHGRVMYVISYSEGGGLSVTPVYPGDDYDLAMEQREPLCHCCVDNLDSLVIKETNNDAQ